MRSLSYKSLFQLFFSGIALIILLLVGLMFYRLQESENEFSVLVQLRNLDQSVQRLQVLVDQPVSFQSQLTLLSKNFDHLVQFKEIQEDILPHQQAARSFVLIQKQLQLIQKYQQQGQNRRLRHHLLTLEHALHRFELNFLQLVKQEFQYIENTILGLALLIVMLLATQALAIAQNHFKQLGHNPHLTPLRTDEGSSRPFVENAMMLEMIGEVADIGGWEYDMMTHQLRWTNKTKQLHGVSLDYQPEVDKAIEFYEEGPHREAIQRHFNNLITHGGPFYLDAVIVRTDKQKLWVRVHGRAHFQNGQCMRLYGTFQDIQQIKEKELAILEKSEQIHRLTDRLKLGIYQFNADAQLQFTFSFISSGFGYLYEHIPLEEGKANPMKYFESVHPDDLPGLMQSIAQSKDQMTDWTYEFRILSPQGEKWIRGISTIAATGEDTVTWYGYLEDVTERKKELEHLRLLESVVTHSKDMIVISEAEPFDLPGPKIIYVNDAFTKTTGFTAAEVLGKTPRILQGPDTNINTLAYLKKRLKTWQITSVELLNYKKDGTPFWVAFTVVPVADDNGRYTHWVAIERDVTEYKNQIAEIEAKNEKLSQIAWQQSHAVRAPLTNLLGFVKLLPDAVSDEEKAEITQQIEASALQLDQIIHQIVSDIMA